MASSSAGFVIAEHRCLAFFHDVFGAAHGVGRIHLKDVADHLTRVFAQNLEARLSGAPAGTAPAGILDAGAVARSAILARIGAFVRRLFGRKA